MRKSIVLAIFGFALLSVSISRAQLVPKVVLVEDATNDGCQPCQIYDPLYFAWLKLHAGSVLHISYHMDDPNYTDPISTNDLQDNQARINYYKIQTIPGINVNGTRYIVEPDLPMVEDQFQQSSAEGSPIAMTVTRHRIDDSVFVHVAIHPVQNLSARSHLRLHVAAVESEIDEYPSEMSKSGYGPDTEVFIDPLRALLPDTLGIPLTLGTRDTSFDLGYDLRPQYDTSKLYEIAFVQDDSTKEEVQAAADRIRFYGMTPASTNLVQRVTADTSQPIRFVTNNNKTWTLTYSPTSPNVWPITINGVAWSVGNPIIIPAGQDTITLVSQRAKGGYSSGLIQATSVDPVTNDSILATWPVKFIAPDTRVGYVYIGFQDSMTQAREIAALNRLPYAYVPLTDGEAKTIGAWNPANFPDLIVSSFDWPTPLENAKIASYLSSGGHLFLTENAPQDNLIISDWSNDQSSWNRYFDLMHIKFQGGAIFSSSIKGWTFGQPNDPITGQYANPSSRLNFAQDFYTENIDVCTPTGSAVPIFHNITLVDSVVAWKDTVVSSIWLDTLRQDTSYDAGIRWDSANTKLVYLCFEFRDVSDTDCFTINQNVLRWFDAPEMGVSSLPATPTDGLTIRPNPAKDRVTIAFGNDLAARVSFDLLDALGVVRIHQRTTGDEVNMDVSGLPNGVYYLRAKTESGAAMSGKVIIAR